MKILWMNHRCIKNPRTGGAERTIFEVGKRLVARGHEVDILTGGWQGASRHEAIEGVSIHRYGSKILPHVVQPIYLRYHKDADVIVDDMAHAAMVHPKYLQNCRLRLWAICLLPWNCLPISSSFSHFRHAVRN